MITARDVIRRVRRNLSDEHSDYHDAVDVLDDLNQALDDLSIRSQSIVTGIYHPAIEGQGKYGLPDSFLHAHFVGFRNQSGHWYPLTETSIKTNTYFIENVVDSRNGAGTAGQSYDPYYYDISGRSAIEKVVAPISEVHTQLSFEIANLPDTVKIGDIVINVTNANATGTITFLDDSIIFINEWVGNAAPGIALENQIRIVSAEIPNQTLVISPVPTFTDATGDESIYVYAAQKHRPITQALIDAENDVLEIDPELESALIDLTTHYASIAEHGVESPTTLMFERRYETKYHRAMPKIRRRIREFRSLWFTTGFNPYRRENLIDYPAVYGHSRNNVNI